MSVITPNVTSDRPARQPDDITGYRSLTDNPAARDELETRFAELESLEPDWDGYGASVPDLLAFREARQFALGSAEQGLPAAEVFPLPDGGVQLEWRVGPVELELEFEAGAKTAVFVCDDFAAEQKFDGQLPRDGARFALAWARLIAHLD